MCKKINMRKKGRVFMIKGLEVYVYQSKSKCFVKDKKDLTYYFILVR
tara:strand:- start:1828 stop:1968 length:141 start_codon:yes stop_codon:yes gene_type:complete